MKKTTAWTTALSIFSSSGAVFNSGIEKVWAAEEEAGAIKPEVLVSVKRDDDD